jgi:hypothetical protein
MVECPPSKLKALSLMASATKKAKKKETVMPFKANYNRSS